MFNQAVKIFGAKADVYLKFDGDMESMARILSKGLYLPEFDFDTDMDEPHEVFGGCEALGFDLWLGNSGLENYPFLLKVGTEHSDKEFLEDKMYDLSPWLARFIAEICDIESYIYNPDTQESFLFEKRNPEIS